MSEKNTTNIDLSRRGFLKRTSLGVAGATAAANVPFVHAASAENDIEIKIGLIGCGGRGTGAVLDAVGAATKVIYPQSGYHTEDLADGAKIEKKNIKVVALADLFEDRLTRCHGQLTKLGIDVPKTKCFTGFDAYQKLVSEPEVNYVILATPPHFRPVQLKAAIEAGKHVFMEKPAAVDVPGVKMVMEAGELAAKKGLGIAAGTQRRHQKNYQETIKRIQKGAIGEIVYAKCYWNGGQIWVIDRKPGWSDMEWQLRNWNYFTWLSGDHIVEQHVHNLDIMRDKALNYTQLCNSLVYALGQCNQRDFAVWPDSTAVATVAGRCHSLFTQRKPRHGELRKGGLATREFGRRSVGVERWH